MSENLLLWLCMLAGGLLTFATRAAFLLGGRRFHPGPRFRLMLGYVPPAVLAALIAPEIFVSKGVLLSDPANPRLWAALAAALVAWKTRSVLATIAVGLLLVWCLPYLPGLL
ncbi:MULTISPECIES: AzlD domain-containing protein [unclassified Uliginosibacterium]|uniref:AzlD domain-containing protein n=1 Tax=unclassified Uliginosibacterium TaxID=2621521 RepID=UPI000C7B07ED|nr:MULTISPECIES: AzlD domain-containing protein [unclassified Uliginosibacterium]MDO6387172.1 AzlD domain-containing protein [Uliginosibacterium sp. 31-12]PLK50810.1 branched-chain amino acid ABC transporter permease [Uliginosibacterium sp. TH139]